MKNHAVEKKSVFISSRCNNVSNIVMLQVFVFCCKKVRENAAIKYASLFAIVWAWGSGYKLRYEL